MASHSGDGSPKEPVAKKLPLRIVCFREPTAIPGVSMMLTTLVANERRLVDGKDWLPPPMWMDPVRREICIEDRRYPMERVHYYERLQVAVKPPPPMDLEKFTLRGSAKSRSK